MLSEVQLHEHQDLHGHVGLVHDGAGEGQMPPVPSLAVHYWEEDIRQVHQPSPAFLHYHTASLSPEDGAGETGDFSLASSGGNEKPLKCTHRRPSPSAQAS